MKYNTFDFFIYIYCTTGHGHTAPRILARDGSKHVFSRKDLPFGGKKLKLIFNSFLCPKGQILAKKYIDLENFQPKTA